jgi:hypothetical protein
MHWTRVSSILMVALLVSGGSPAPGGAQVADRLRKKAEELAKKRAEEDAKKKQQKAGPAVADSSKAPATTRGADSTKGAEPTPATAPNATPVAAKVWENYDFVPGNKVLFYSDFS